MEDDEALPDDSQIDPRYQAGGDHLQMHMLKKCGDWR